MKCRFTVKRLSVGLLLSVVGAVPCWSQQPGYVSPTFSQMGGAVSNGSMHQASQIPTNMTSPLAGGPAAAAGNQFVDIHGNPIILPTNFQAPMQGYSPAMGGMQGAYGDPMAVDFGGYSEDQIGPHYFDVSFGVVYLKPEYILDGVGDLASTNIGPAAPRVLNPSDGLDDYYPGWQVALRYDLGPLSLFEATYLGSYDIGFSESAASVPGGTNNLNTIFSNFGVPAPIPGLDAGSLYTINYESDFQSTELSYRRYWVGNSSRVSGTYLLGFRYLRLTEQFNFNAVADDGNGVGNNVTSNLAWDTANDLLGFQLGGDGWLGLRQGLRIGCDGKAGVYNNRFKFNGVGNFAPVAGAPTDYDIPVDGNQVAFIGEAGVSVVADLWPSWSITGGYHVYYIDNLTTVASNIDTSNFVPTTVSSENDALYHGFTAGAEYVW